MKLLQKEIVLSTSMIFVACSAPDENAHSIGMFDSGGHGTIDASADGATDADLVAVDASGLDSGAQCERGQYWDGEKCSTLVGCSGIALIHDEHGCLFLPGTQGRLTAAECEMDLDCEESPYGPNCILRVCHESAPCDVDEDCEEGLACVNQATCIPPGEECMNHGDCEPYATCIASLGVCG